MMTRLCWSFVELASRLLDQPEREVVRGDLAECGAGAGRALREVLGLVVRRQAAAWFDWRPWFILAAIVIPIGFLLSHASRWWGVHHAINLANYWVLWDVSYLAYPGYRNDVIRMAVWTGAAWLALAGWSWTTGFVVGRVSRRTVWLTVVLFAVVIFAATLGTVTSAQRTPNPSLRYHLIFVVFPRLLRTFLVMLPMVVGGAAGCLDDCSADCGDCLLCSPSGVLAALAPLAPPASGGGELPAAVPLAPASDPQRIDHVPRRLA